MNSLQNSAQVINSTNELPTPPNPITRSAPPLPPLPRNSANVPNPTAAQYNYNSYMPYSNGYNNFGYGNYNSMMMPYRYNTPYGTYNNYGMCPPYSNVAEQRFIQYAEESSRDTFANVESIVRAVNSISMMLDNTFFAMTSSFRAVLSVAENFGRLRNMFGQIWYSINIFRLFNWLYRKLMSLFGRNVPKSATSIAWNEAASGNLPPPVPPDSSSAGSSWPTLAFLGVLISAPYFISKFLPKYEDRYDPNNWKSPGIRAKAAFDFVQRNSNELSVKTNDIVMLAPLHIQKEMNLLQSDWAFASCNGQTGILPINYLLNMENKSSANSKKLNGSSNNNNNNTIKTHTKRVSFGENQIFENVDLEDYVTGKKVVRRVDDEVVNKKNEEHLIKEKKLVPGNNNEGNNENTNDIKSVNVEQVIVNDPNNYN